MKILFEVGHPAHVHLFKNVIWNLEQGGHKVLIKARDKEFTLNLLDKYNLNYKIIGYNYTTLAKKAYGLIKTDIKLFNVARSFKPDILVGRGSPYLAHLSVLINKPYIAFVDTEHARLNSWLSHPFADVIWVPSCFKGKINPRKELRFNGYKELAYLHPNYFKPDTSVLDDLGLSKDDKFVIVRFVSWNASHDIKQKGFDLQTKKELIKEIEKRAQVFITSEKLLTKDFEKYRITIPPERIHDLLYYATMYIGEGATMASEAAVLGTPAIYVNTQRLGYLDEQEERYGLVYIFSNPKTAQRDAVTKAIELLEDENVKSKWQRKKEKLLSEKIDVTKFMTEFIENYPESFTNIKP